MSWLCIAFHICDQGSKPSWYVLLKLISLIFLFEYATAVISIKIRGKSKSEII